VDVVRRELIAPEPAQALAGLLDTSLTGDELSALCHWLFAGGACVRYRPLIIGLPAERRSWVSARSEKQGRSGPLEPTPAAEKYNEPPSTTAAYFNVDPVVLFRFSALTYNSHRIHYDREFALTEGHPDLVIHGPLQAVLMANYAYAVQDQRAADGESRFDFRLVAPAYGAQRLAIDATAADEVAVGDAAGNLTATATLRDKPCQPSTL
jgi:3-methylfumaryl-CoA hydratase